MLQLRAIIGYSHLIILTLQIFGYKVHRAGTVQGNACDNILQVFRLKLLHEALHSRAFQLEHSLCPSGSNRVQHLPVIKINLVYVNRNTKILFHKPYRILNDRQGSKPEKVHF